jgi:hypothetical protein
MCKGLPDRGKKKSQGGLNHLQQQVTDGNVLSRIIVISFQKITTYERTLVPISWRCCFAEFPPAKRSISYYKRQKQFYNLYTRTNNLALYSHVSFLYLSLTERRCFNFQTYKYPVIRTVSYETVLFNLTCSISELSTNDPCPESPKRTLMNSNLCIITTKLNLE